MNSIEFGNIIKPLNLRYKELFNYIPCISDYSCSREEYIKAMEEALIQKREISAFLSRTVPIQMTGVET